MPTFPPQSPPPPGPPGSAPPGPQKTSGLAVGALVGAFLCAPVGLILGIVALMKVGQDPTLKGKGLAIGAIVVSAVLLLCLPLPAIAIPNFLRFQARAKQAECQAHLRAAYSAQRMLFGEDERYSQRPDELGLSFEGTRYAYFFGPEANFEGEGASAVRPTRPENLDLDTAFRRVVAAGARPGIYGECPDDCSVTIACAGNLDSDSTFDVWSVSSSDRQIGTEWVPAGQPHNHVSDVTD